MAGILITLGEHAQGDHGRARDFFIHQRGMELSHEEQDGNLFLSKLSRKRSDDQNCLEDGHTCIWSVGRLIYKGSIGMEAIMHLQNDLRNSSIENLTDFLDGPFFLVVRKNSEKGCWLVTDHAGIMNIYKYSSQSKLSLSSSSMALSRNYPVTIDQDSVTQFLRTGNVYGSRTIYREIELLRPASLYYINDTSKPGIELLKQYWKSPVSTWEDLGFEEARDLLAGHLIKHFATISKENLICDFTAGFDSRLIISVLSKIQSLQDIHTFVFGPDSSPEVQLVKEYCRHTGILNDHLPLPADWNERIFDYVKRSLLITDGEENVFVYAPILWAQEYKSRDYACSVGGLGGELYRDFWWIQEVFSAKRPANLDRLIDMRVLQYEYDYSLFSRQWKPAMMDVKKIIKNTYLDTLSDMDVEESYNTLQIDNLYFREKIRRWAGRTMSSSSQTISVLAPLTSRKCVETALSIPPKYKRSGRLVKGVIENISRPLSELRMLNGEPCQNITLLNAHRFAPLVLDYGKRGIRKAVQKAVKRTIFVDRSVSYQQSSFFHDLFSDSSFRKEYSYPSLLAQEIYNPDNYKTFYEKAARDGFPYYNQLGNILTLEMRMRGDNIQSGL